MALRLWGGVLAVGAALALGGAARAERFDFVAIGDTAYNPSVDYPVYEALIARINKARPAFTIHVGDTWGALPCTEAQHRSILGGVVRRRGGAVQVDVIHLLRAEFRPRQCLLHRQDRAGALGMGGAHVMGVAAFSITQQQGARIVRFGPFQQREPGRLADVQTVAVDVPRSAGLG